MSAWGTPIEIERRRRIHIAAWAYAYEVEGDPVVDDETFDREALLIQPETSTGNDELDTFFRSEFAAYTGAWVHKHPDKPGLRRVLGFMREAQGRKRGVLREIAEALKDEPAPIEPVELVQQTLF